MHDDATFDSLVPSENLPAVHDVQELLLVPPAADENLPAVHDVHELLLAAAYAYLPAGQMVQP